MPHVWWHQCAFWHEQRLRCPFLEDEEDDDDDDPDDPEEQKRDRPIVPRFKRVPVPIPALEEAARVPMPVRVGRPEQVPALEEVTGVPPHLPPPPGVPGRSPVRIPVQPGIKVPRPHRIPRKVRVPIQPKVPKRQPIGVREREAQFIAKKIQQPGHREVLEAFAETGFQTSKTKREDFVFPQDAVARAAAAERLLTRSVRALMNRSNKTVDAVSEGKGKVVLRRGKKTGQSQGFGGEESFQRARGDKRSRTKRRLRREAKARATAAGKAIQRNISIGMPAPQRGGRGGGLHVNVSADLRKLIGRR